MTDEDIDRLKELLRENGDADEDAAFAHRVLEALDSHRHLRNLLARIHRDGGHHTDACGLEKSVLDADAAVAMYISAYDAQRRS